MPTVKLSPTAGILLQCFTTGGLPLNAGLLYTYAAGSTTPQATYTTSAGSVQNANPIVLDADGRTPNEVWLVQGSTYRFDLKDSLGNLIKSYDNITGINDIASEIVGVYLPLAGGTMTGNLVVPDNMLDIVGSSDATKILNFEVDGLTTATTRTLSVQDKNGTVSLNGNGAPRFLANAGLAVTMAANACTIALKQADGSTDPTSGSPVSVGFRSATLTSGAVSVVTAAAALSTVISNGSTGGTVSAVASRIWVAAINNAGTIELAWFNAGSQTNGTFFDEGALISTTAEGGIGGADSQGVWYSTTARSSVPFVIVGYFDSTQAMAGAWATSVTDIVVNPRGVPVRTINLGTAQATTSGTSIDFLNIPAGVRRLTINLVGVSTNGSSNRLFQIGTGGAPTTSGYLGAGGFGTTVANFTTGIGVNAGSASDLLHGTIIFMLVSASANTWVAHGVFGTSGTTQAFITGGSVSLAGTLDMIRMTTVNGTDAYDLGSVNITYE